MEERLSHEVSGDHIPEPEAAHTHREQDPDDEREATELQRVDRTRPPPLSRILSPGKPKLHWYDPITKFWRHNIRISVPHVDCRDHLANERTYLGYLRTSVAISILGVMIEQLYRLNHSEDPSAIFGYYVLSKPLAAILQCAALGMTLLGAIRFLRQQHAMSIGKVHAGGWEIFVIVGSMSLLLIALFAIHIGIDAYKSG